MRVRLAKDNDNGDDDDWFWLKRYSVVFSCSSIRWCLAGWVSTLGLSGNCVFISVLGFSNSTERVVCGAIQYFTVLTFVCINYVGYWT